MMKAQILLQYQWHLMKLKSFLSDISFESFYRCKSPPVMVNFVFMGSGCGSVGRAVASNTRGPGFESSHRQLLLNIYLLLTVCRKDENKEKEAGNGPIFKKYSCCNLTAIVLQQAQFYSIGPSNNKCTSIKMYLRENNVNTEDKISLDTGQKLVRC